MLLRRLTHETFARIAIAVETTSDVSAPEPVQPPPPRKPRVSWWQTLLGRFGGQP